MALTVEGLTHASSVIPVDSCSEAALGIETNAFVPLNCSALPYLPVAAQAAFVIVPVFPLPDASVTVVPDPSSNPYAATSPVVAAIEAGADAIPGTPIIAAIARRLSAKPDRRIFTPHKCAHRPTASLQDPKRARPQRRSDQATPGSQSRP